MPQAAAARGRGNTQEDEGNIATSAAEVESHLLVGVPLTTRRVMSRAFAAVALCVFALRPADAFVLPTGARLLTTAPPTTLSHGQHSRRVQAGAIVAAEYSTKVKIMAETRAPLRQARIFFLYPSTIAGASIATYVSLLRVIGGKDALSDAGNLVVNALVIAAAAFLLKKDLDGRAAALEEIAIELGEASAPTEAPPADVED